MLIEKISIVSFGKLKNLELELGSGLNIIEGKNESGKSTIFAFIRYMLYGFSGKSDASSIPDKHRYISWDTSTAKGSMTVSSADGKKYRIDRSAYFSTTSSGKEQYKEDSAIIDLSDNSPVFPKQKAGEVLFRLPEEIFDKIAFVSQISDTEVDGVAISEAIENILFSGDEKISAQRALDKIDAARRTLLHKNEKGGEIYNISTKITELNKQFEAAVSENELILEQKAQLKKTTADISQTENEIERLSKNLEAYQKMQLAESFKKLHQLEQKRELLRSERDTLIAENTVDGFCPDSSYISELAVSNRSVEDALHSVATAKKIENDAKAKAQLPEDRARLLEAAEKKGGIATALSIERKQRSAKKTTLCLSLICLFFSLVSAVARFLALADSVLPLAISAVLLIFFILFFAISLGKSKKCREIYDSFGTSSHSAFVLLISELREAAEENLRCKQALALAEKNTENSLLSYRQKLNEFSSVLSRFGRKPPLENEDRGEYLEKLSSYILSFRDEENEKNLEILKLTTTIDELSSRLSSLDEGEINEYLTPEVLASIKDIDINDVKKTLLFNQEKQKALLARERDLRSRYLSLNAKSTPPSQIKERIDEYEGRLLSLKKQYDAYLLASEAISGAGDRLRRSLSPKLSEYTGNAVDKITDGKYTEIGVSPSLSMTYTYENATRSPKALSHGTSAAIYLSMRLALIDLLCSEKIPFCLDESLVYQDEGRAKNILSLLESEAEDKLQVFVFTCHQREAKLLKGKKATIIKI